MISSNRQFIFEINQIDMCYSLYPSITEFPVVLKPEDLNSQTGFTSIYSSIAMGKLLIEFLNLDYSALEQLFIDTYEDICSIPLREKLKNEIDTLDIYRKSLDTALWSEFGISHELRSLLILEAEQALIHAGRTTEQYRASNGALCRKLSFASLSTCYKKSRIFLENTMVDKSSDLEWLPTSTPIQSNLVITSSEFKFVHTLKSFTDFIYLEILNIKKHNPAINKCHNCGKYFLPSSRSNEIYCDNIYDHENNRTCKDIGYTIKLRHDKFRTAYRTAYKTQRARIRYNSHIENYEEIHFKPWEKDAKKALKDYQDKNDLDGFKLWLKNNRDKYK